MLLQAPGFFKAQGLAVVLTVLLLQGCGLFGGEQEAPNESGMEISVKFQDVHRCSRISPEIMIVNAPKGATVYDVRLIENQGLEEIVLGGGTWSEDGSGIIPEGALTGHYSGPCPPKGQSRKYIYVVSARHAQNPQPLAVRVYSFVVE